MAITREQVLAAVEKYLPRTVNFAQSEDLGNRNPDAIFDRIQQILLTSLLVDKESVYYIIYLAAQRLLGDIDTAISLLEALRSVEQLKGITGEDPRRIEDYTKLEAAGTSLVRLSSGVVTDGVFGETALSQFSSDVSGFLADEVKPNVQGGNRAQISRDIRATMESLQSAWARVYERRDRLFQMLDSYVDEDLRTRVSAIIISAIQVTIQELLEELPALSTTQQAEVAEQVMVDLAAAEASLRIVGSAESPVGSILDQGFDGFTQATYLLLEGTGRLEPIDALLAGTDGRNRFTGPAPGGSSFTSLTGQTVDTGGTFTDTLQDPGVADFTAEGITEGMFLTFVELGTTHVITAVTASDLTLSPTTKHRAATPQRYAITDRAPGSLFASATGSFWTQPGNGTTGSTQIAAGTLGILPRVTKLVATDGTNIVASGTTATFRPRKTSGSTSDQGPFGFPPNPATYFEDLNATLLSDLVAGGDVLVITDGANAGTHSIVSVDTQTSLTAGTAFAAETGANNSWYVEDPSAVLWVEDLNATFLTAGVTTSHTLRFTSAPTNGAGDYSITDVLSQNILETSGGPHTYETGADYEIRLTANNQIRSATDFFVAGVTVGDIVEISGEGTFTVTAVAQFVLTLDSALSSVSVSGATVTVYAPFYVTLTDRMSHGDAANFEALNVSSLVEVDEYRSGVAVETPYPATLAYDGVSYRVRGRDADSPTDTLTIFPLVQGLGEFIASTTLEDTTQDFLSAGVSASKHGLYVVAGPNAGTVFAISSVTATQITVVGAAIGEDASYQIWPLIDAGPTAWEVNYGSRSKSFTDISGTAPFTASSVGWEIVWDPEGPNEERAKVDTYISPTEVWLSSSLPEGQTGPYAFVDVVSQGQELVAAGRTYAVLQVVNSTTLEVDPPLSNSVGKNVDYQVLRSRAQSKFVSRVYDPTGAALYDGVEGFKTDLKGLTVELNLDQPVTTTFARPYDPGSDGFAEAFQVETSFALGRRQVSYRITNGTEGTSTEFLAPTAALGTPPAEGDTLTVWEIPDIFTITDAAFGVGGNDVYTVQPALTARLTNQVYAITRDGGDNYGRYVIMDTLNDQLVLDESTAGLRLRVAEVLLDFGDIILPAVSGADGVVLEDGDADGESTIFESASGAFRTNGVQAGDRLQIDYGGATGTVVTYVSRVVSETRLRVDPELPEGAALTWSLGRNSVSISLVETERLRQQLLALRAVLVNYTIDPNATIAGVIDLLEAQRLDRAVDLLYDGKVSEFVNLSRLASSYATLARSSVQTVGASTKTSPATASQAAGRNPSLSAAGTTTTFSTAGAAAAAGTDDELTGAALDAGLASAGKASPVSPSSVSGPRSSTSATTGYGSGVLPEEVEVRVALAKAVNDLASDELLRSLAFQTFEEARNRAIYELSGEIESGIITDTDPTLPWIAKTGSIRDRIDTRYQSIRAAIQYMIDNPEKFDDADVDNLAEGT